MTQPSEQADVLFYEPGASWWWLSAGPVAGIAMVLIQMSAGLGIQWLVPTVFFVLVTGFVAVQVKAARIHTSVELTPDRAASGHRAHTHRRHRAGLSGAGGQRGTPVAVRAGARRAHRCAAGRTGIGVRLTNDRTAQAWARKHRQLRAQLTHLIDERIPPEPKT